ncbi:MAG: site-2 protease family protein [Planctomycetaceae bacterium]
MLGQIPPTSFDLRFSVAGIPVRVHPVFWATAAFLAWDGSDPPATFLGVLCVFLSILVHELGHAGMTRCFGWDSEIVLGFFGGYATTVRESTARNIAVLIAGPGAGLLLAATTFVVLLQVEGLSPRTVDALRFLLFINLIWSLVNLLPVLPLDGGQLLREILVWANRQRGQQRAVVLSTVVAGVIAISGYLFGPRVGLDGTFLAILFGLLAYQNYATWQALRGGGRPPRNMDLPPPPDRPF